jgi:hypothetical protein
VQTVDPRVGRAGPALAASNPGRHEGGAPRRLCARRSHNNFPTDDNAHYIIDIKGDWILGPGVPSCRAAGPWRARLARFATGTGVCSVIWVPDALT